MTMCVSVAALLSVLLASVDCVQSTFKPLDCSDRYNAGETLSGIYSIYPVGDAPIWVYCHMVSGGKAEDNGGWTVIQRRMDGSVNFYQLWNEYKRGFGLTQGEYWLGLENMHQLTRNRRYALRVDVEDFTGSKGFALYSSFSVGPEADGYKLQVSGFKNGGAGDSLTHHSGQKFTTFDKDQDIFPRNCAEKYVAAFWYKDCYWSNPNGVYLWGQSPTHEGIGIVWYTWKNDITTSMKSLIMKIKPAT